MRLYHNITAVERPKKKLLCYLYCEYPHVDFCYTPVIFPTKPDEEPSNIDANSHDRESQKNKKWTVTNDGREMDNEIIRDPPKIENAESASSTLEGNPTALNFFNLFLKSSKKSQGNQSYAERLIPKMWRYLPMADPTVAEFLVRDVDSTILPREVAAVTQWLNETTGIMHAMRDHPSHNGVILAGKINRF